MSEITLVDERFDRAPSNQDALTLSPLQLLGVLRRNWLLILFFGLLFGTAAYVYTKAVVPKQYTTSGVLALDLSKMAIPALQGATNGEVLPDPLPIVRTEVQVLTSRALLQQVADQLDLYALPEFNGTLRPPSLTARLKTDVAQLLPLSVLRPLAAAGLLPNVTKPAQPPPQLVVRDAVLGAVAHDLSVINDGRSLIITVQFTATDPVIAAKVVNSVIQHYVEDRSHSQVQTNVQANSELSRRVQAMRQEIDGLETKIAATREKYNLVQTRAGSVGQQQLEDLTTALTKSSADRAQAVANYDRAAAMAKTGALPNDVAAVLGSGTITALRDRESTAERRVALLSTTLGPRHPQLRAARAELASVQSSLASETRRVIGSLAAAADAAKAREADLKRQLAVAEKSAGGLASVQSELQQLEKDADSRRAIYQTLLQGEAQTASKAAGGGQSGIRVVSKAVTPAFPSSPRPKMAAALGLAGGFAFGGLVSLTRKRRDRGFRQPDDVLSITGITPLTIVPRPAGGATLAQRVVADPSGPEAESLRALRTRLRFATQAAPRSLLFVSTMDEEGAADMALALARVAAMDGVRTILVEGNLQAPKLACAMHMAVGDGLLDVLMGREHWQDQVQRDTLTPLEALLTETAPAAAAQLLDSMQLQNLVAEAREDYNLLVMTGHPVDGATQTMVLANIVDAVVLVVGARRGKRKAVQDAIDTLATASRRQPSVALNKAA